MEKNTKTLLVIGGVAFAGVVAIYLYKSMNPTRPMVYPNVVGGAYGYGTPSNPGYSLNINNALSQIGGWFGLGKSTTPPPTQTTTAFVGTGVHYANGDKKKTKINGTF
jgi:hypothetical protein